METSLVASCQPPDFNILCYSPATDMQLKRESNNVYSLIWKNHMITLANFKNSQSVVANTSSRWALPVK